MYYEGLGVDQNYQKAFEWIEQAANQGYANAQFDLGVMYHEGIAVEQDEIKMSLLKGKKRKAKRRQE